ncbi:MAG: IclR family transcriptional regulator [Novosphingobium sp.]|nr:IclR family transcriptional regulator [Novosphingobium sp.]
MSAAKARAEAEDRRAPPPQSVTRVMRILEALCASAEPISLADLSRTLESPKSSLAALLRGLAEENFVVSADGAWRLGPGAFGLGSALTEARRRFQSSDLIRDAMRRLAGHSGETVLLGVLDEDAQVMTYVDVVESRNAVRFAVAIGDRRPLYATAGGRVLLAARPTDDVAAYFDQLAPGTLTASTETGKARLAEIVDHARNAGFAQTIDQASDGVTGTASVIRDAASVVIGALIVAAPSSRSQDRLDALAQLVCEEAGAISRSLGYRG